MIDAVEKDLNGIEGIAVILPKVFGDERGYFFESYNDRDFSKVYGETVKFVQDNQSFSTKGTIRGLHFQISYPQGKLVRVLSGAVYDVAVDLRRNSKTFGRHFGVVLSAENKKQFYIPEGFAHGFLVLSNEAEFSYKVTDYYYPKDEAGILWNDPDLNVAWPFQEYKIKEEDVILSKKDRKNLSWNSYLMEYAV